MRVRPLVVTAPSVSLSGGGEESGEFRWSGRDYRRTRGLYVSPLSYRVLCDTRVWILVVQQVLAVECLFVWVSVGRILGKGVLPTQDEDFVKVPSP